MQLKVWGKEREVNKLKESLITLTSKLKDMCTVKKDGEEAEDSLRKKWRKIDKFHSLDIRT